LTALRHETGHNSRPYDIGSVPVALVDEVTSVIKAERPDNLWLHENLDLAVAEKKAAAATWDEMLEKSFLESWMSK